MRGSALVHASVENLHSPKSNEAVESSDRRSFSSWLEEIRRAVADLVVDAVGNGATDAETHEDDEVDEDVEVGLLFDLGALRGGLACGGRGQRG